MTTCKTSRINEVWLNATTDEVLWSMAPPAKIATITTTIDDPIAAKEKPDESGIFGGGAACGAGHADHAVLPSGFIDRR